MLTRTRNLVGALVVSAAMVLTPMAAGSASAQQAGLVNVEIGDVTILENVGIGVAAQVVAQLCGVSVQNVALLAVNVAQTGGETNAICTVEEGPVTGPVTISD